ncbi:hypothetical protein [Sphingomonas lenta]|uniref:Uncharacterized protein n=1 Tax=Sphingomonas lenta TaxID=1141887 RepID=A0A2A2SCI3_9SPHN|nr:hypothetical protein [Sphingomonas lenta]PAX06959.1 hypothetical protein CKY28_12890 [Sphingomonas lenta]
MMRTVSEHATRSGARATGSPSADTGAGASGLQLLRIVLAVKIVGTVLPFALPLLLMSADALRQSFGYAPEPLLVARLLGWSYLAILIGYAGGFLEARRGVFPTTAVAMGVASSAGASAIQASVLFGSGATRGPAASDLLALGFTAGVTATLLFCWRQATRR